MSALRLLIFDCDGTLVDSAAHIVRAMENAFRSHGLTPPPDAAIRGIIGLSLPDAMVALAADESEAHDDLVAAYKVHYRDAMVREALAEPLYPGVMEMLDAVSTEATLLGVA
ncbi:MAG: HAD hydrolase-like protein, partial [Pseudomonadota bacterium]